MSEYEKQGIDFLSDTKTSFKAEFLEHGKHFADDKEDRDIYNITLSRGSRDFKFKFGQSIVHSGKYKILSAYNISNWINDNNKIVDKFNNGQRLFNELPKGTGFIKNRDWVENKDFAEPSAYSVLACLTCYDPEDFNEFCSSFGYEEDSIKAHKIYKAVCKEWDEVQKLWTDEEIEKLQEIQ